MFRVPGKGSGFSLFWFLGCKASGFNQTGRDEDVQGRLVTFSSRMPKTSEHKQQTTTRNLNSKP